MVVSVSSDKYVHHHRIKVRSISRYYYLGRYEPGCVLSHGNDEIVVFRS